jgi:hypothetical protein
LNQSGLGSNPNPPTKFSPDNGLLPCLLIGKKTGSEPVNVGSSPTEATKFMTGLSIIGAMGLGKLIAFSFIWIHDKMCPYKPEPLFISDLPRIESIFFDKEYIKNLKI